MEVHFYIYVAWFRDLSLSPNDQDYEWPAVIAISADSAEKAKEWGDHLSKRKSQLSRNEQFLWSEIESPAKQQESKATILDNLPRVSYGSEVSDDQIGW